MPTTTTYHHHPPPPLPYHPTAYNGYPYMPPPYNMQHMMMPPPIQHHRTPMPPIQHQQQAPTTNPFNVTVIPAKKLTRKRKYCKQEGCKLKQRKGEYCFKHHAMNAIAIVHDGAAPDLTKLVPPTIQEVQQQLTTTHRERSVAVVDSCKRVPPPANTNDQVAFTLYREAKKQQTKKPRIQQVPRSRSESISSLQHKQSQEQEMEMMQLLHKQQLETLRFQHLLQQCRDDVVEAATTVRSATYDYDQRTSMGGECISRDHPSDANKQSLQQLETELRLLRQFQQYQIPVYKNVNSMGEQQRQRSIPIASRDRRDETVRRTDYDQGIEECRDPSPVDYPSPVVDLTAEEDTSQVACHVTRKRKISQSSSDPSTAARPNKMSTSQVACHDTKKRKISQSSTSDPYSTTRPNKMSLLLQALEEKLE